MPTHRNCEVVNVCCFQLLSLWWFVRKLTQGVNVFCMRRRCELSGQMMAWGTQFPKRATTNSSVHIYCVPHIKSWNLISSPWFWAGLTQCLLPIEYDGSDVLRLHGGHKEFWSFFLGLIEPLHLVVLTQCVRYLPYWKDHMERPRGERCLAILDPSWTQPSSLPC